MKRVEPLRLLIFRRGQALEREVDLEAGLRYYNIMLAAAVNTNDSEGITFFPRQHLIHFQSELKLLKQLGYPDKKNLKQVSKFLLYLIDSIIHHHVIYGESLLKDEELLVI